MHVVTIVCVRVGVLSYQARTSRRTIMTVDVASPISQDAEQRLRRSLRDVESVTLMSFRDEQIRIHIRVGVRDQVLDRIRGEGLEVKRVRIP